MRTHCSNFPHQSRDPTQCFSLMDVTSFMLEDCLSSAGPFLCFGSGYNGICSHFALFFSLFVVFKQLKVPVFGDMLSRR